MNAKQMAALQPGQTLWDDKTKGLHLRAFTEKKVFYLYYRTKTGIQRKPKIGDYASITLDQAREIANGMLLRVANGEDPSEEIQTARHEMTIKALFDLTLKGHWSSEKFVKSRYNYEVTRLYNAHIHPYFAGMCLSHMTAKKVRLWHATFEHTPIEGNRALEVLSKMFAYAEEQELQPQNTNPCKLVKRFKERGRKRFASDIELRRLASILESEWHTYPRECTFIYLLLYTGARPSFIERAKIDDLYICGTEDVSGAISMEGKTGLETVEFSKQAIEVIARLTAKLFKDGICTTRETLTGIKFPRAFWERVRAQAGCPDLWARDLRRTFATVGMGIGVDMRVVSELLNHKSAQTTKRYAVLTDAKRKDVAAKTSTALEGIINGPTEAK